MKLNLTIIIPGKDTKATRQQIALVLAEVVKALPYHRAGSGQCYDQNGSDYGYFFLFTDPKAPKTTP